MARFSLINLGLHGHINPSLATVRELIARGHSLSYFAPEEFGPLICSTGAEFHSYRSVFSRPVPGFMDEKGGTPMPIRLVTDCLQAIPQLLNRVAAENPDVILYDLMCLQGRLIAEILKKPAICLSPSFVLNEKVSTKTKAMNNSIVLDFTKSGIAQICAEFRVTPFHFHDVFAKPAALNIVFTSEDFQPNREFFDERYVFVGSGMEDPSDVPPARGDKPFVYVSLGTVYNQRPDFFRACPTELQRGTPKRAMIVVGNQVGPSPGEPFPPNTEIVRHADQIHMLRQADVFVSHGGMNSLMEALYFGVPVVLFPQMEEQQANAENAVAHGAGLMLREISELGETVNRILGNAEYRKNAKYLGQRIRKSGGFRRAADRIEAFRPETGVLDC